LGNNYILVITDYFTKWVEVIPLANTTALATTKALMDRVILYHGPPRTVVTDRGANFTSNLFTSLCKSIQIKYLKITAYHPQTNGLTERFNRTMMAMLRKYVKDGFSKWEDALGPIAFAYRNSVHSSTNETPYFLNHGRDPVLPIDQFLCVPKYVSTVPSDYKSQLMKRIHDAFKLVKQSMRESRLQQQKQYNKRAEDLSYEIGDRVLLTMKTPLLKTSKKLIPRFIGPYRITKINSNHTVEIQEFPGKQTQLVHVNRLKPLCESMIWRDLPNVILDKVERPPSVLNLSLSSETIANSPPPSPVSLHDVPPDASLDLLTFDDVPDGTLGVSISPDVPNIRAPPNTPADSSTSTTDNLPPRRAGLRPRHLLKTVLP
jgi:hypothetical protein